MIGAESGCVARMPGTSAVRVRFFPVVAADCMMLGKLHDILSPSFNWPAMQHASSAVYLWRHPSPADPKSCICFTLDGVLCLTLEAASTFWQPIEHVIWRCFSPLLVHLVIHPCCGLDGYGAPLIFGI